MFASRFCRKPVMIGTALPPETMRRVARQMASLDQPWNCPHGRPTLRHLSDMAAARAAARVVRADAAACYTAPADAREAALARGRRGSRRCAAPPA
jgi:hypothetical protein